MYGTKKNLINIKYIMKKSILSIDSSYPYQIMKERKLFSIVLGRNLNGYFSKIWNCNPVSTILEKKNSKNRYGKLNFFRYSSSILFIEAKMGRYKFLSYFEKINFFISQISLLISLIKIIKKYQIKLIRSENPYYNGILAYILSKVCKIPFIVGVWGNPGKIRTYTQKPIMKKLFKKVWVEELVEKFILKKAKFVIVQNLDNKKFVLSRGILDEKIKLFYFGNVIDKIHFTEPKHRKFENKNLILNKNSQSILVISRLEKLKLVDHVLYAFSMIDKKIDCTLFFVGDGEYKNEMIEISKKLGILDKVVFCGNKDQKWIANFIPQMSVVVSPLTGRALAEVSFGAAPVVAYDLDWHAEIIENNKTGLLVKAYDYKSMSKSIEKMLLNKDEAKAMGLSLRKRTWQLLDPNLCDKQQKSIFDIIYN